MVIEKPAPRKTYLPLEYDALVAEDGIGNKFSTMVLSIESLIILLLVLLHQTTESLALARYQGIKHFA